MVKVANPSILAAMAGVTNGEFARKYLIYGKAGMVTIGGYSIGKEMIIASLEAVKNGRKEFILQAGEEAIMISKEIIKIPRVSYLIINLRINNVKDAISFAQELSNLLDEKPIIEVNAHCRQFEILKYGGGQSLLNRIDILSGIIDAFCSKDFKISLKIRGNRIKPRILIPKIEHWSLDFLHIDSYKTGIEGTDLDLLNEYTQHVNPFVIGNNSVIDIKSAQAILNTGAYFYSVARAAKRNPLIFKELMKGF